MSFHHKLFLVLIFASLYHRPNILNLSNIAELPTDYGLNLKHRFKVKDEERIWIGDSNLNRRYKAVKKILIQSLVWLNNLGLTYQRFTTSGCKDIENLSLWPDLIISEQVYFPSNYFYTLGLHTPAHSLHISPFFWRKKILKKKLFISQGSQESFVKTGLS